MSNTVIPMATCKRKHIFGEMQFNLCEDCKTDDIAVWCKHCGNEMCEFCSEYHCCCEVK